MQFFVTLPKTKYMCLHLFGEMRSHLVLSRVMRVTTVYICKLELLRLFLSHYARPLWNRLLRCPSKLYYVRFWVRCRATCSSFEWPTLGRGIGGIALYTVAPFCGHTSSRNIPVPPRQFSVPACGETHATVEVYLVLVRLFP